MAEVSGTSVIGTADIVEHIRRRIAAAEVQLDPFPHFVTTDLLPDSAYEEILANWPPPTT